MQNTVDISGLSYTRTAAEVKSLLAKDFEVLEVRIRVSPYTSRSSGTGEVVFASVSEALRAVASLNGQKLGQDVLEVVMRPN